jgi:hypothetical protein
MYYRCIRTVNMRDGGRATGELAYIEGKIYRFDRLQDDSHDLVGTSELYDDHKWKSRTKEFRIHFSHVHENTYKAWLANKPKLPINFGEYL